MGRRNEIIALRSGGVSLMQTAAPVLVLSFAISVAALVWNETVVPYASRKFQYVNNIEIRKRALRGVLSERAIWYHGGDGFYHITDYVDREQQAVFDVTIYRLDGAFHLRSVVRAARADWRDRTMAGHRRGRVPDDRWDGERNPVSADGLRIGETWTISSKCSAGQGSSGFAALRDRIDDLARARHRRLALPVDLYLKLALPFASLVLAAVAVPIAGQLRRNPSIAAIVSWAQTGIGFGYWVVLGLSTSLGQTGALPPLVAAWAANGVPAGGRRALPVERVSARPTPALRVLRTLARLVPAVLLALDLARVARDESAFFQAPGGSRDSPPPCRGDAVANCRCLGRHAAADHVDARRRTILGAGELERLVDNHAQGRAAEVLIQRAPVDAVLPSPGRSRTRATAVFTCPWPRGPSSVPP
jgi:lipopolysaccharide export system permease protein